jgi:hypothetical protein
MELKKAEVYVGYRGSEQSMEGLCQHFSDVWVIFRGYHCWKTNDQLITKFSRSIVSLRIGLNEIASQFFGGPMVFSRKKRKRLKK